MLLGSILPVRNRSKKNNSHPDHTAAISLIRTELERREKRLIDLRGATLLHDFEKSMDRDQFTYCMGRADECRELLMCLGVSPLDLQTAVTVEMKKRLGWR